MNNGQKLWRTEKVNFVEHFIPFRMKQLQRICKSVKFPETESTRNVDVSMLSIEIKNMLKQV